MPEDGLGQRGTAVPGLRPWRRGGSGSPGDVQEVSTLARACHLCHNPRDEPLSGAEEEQE